MGVIMKKIILTGVACVLLGGVALAYGYGNCKTDFFCMSRCQSYGGTRAECFQACTVCR